MSYVNSQSRHERLNFESIKAFQRVAHWVKQSIPVILETPIQSNEIDEEISAAEQVFAPASAYTKERRSTNKSRILHIGCTEGTPDE